MKQALIEKMNSLLSTKTPFVVSTITKFIGSTPRKIEAKMITYHSHGRTEIFDTIGGGKLEKEVVEDASNLITNSGTSFVKEYILDESNDMACGGKVEVFHEITQKRSDLYIFGAGHVAHALTRVLDGGPFTTHVIDERSDWALSEKIPEGVIRHNMMWNQFTKDACWDADSTYIIIMTHDHKYDSDILADVIKREAKYIGLMGSKSKWASSQNKLNEMGISEKMLERVICPIGDKSLGKGPTEIAIGIAAQILKQFQNLKSSR